MTFLPGYDCAWNYTKACGAADEPCEAGYNEESDGFHAKVYRSFSMTSSA